MTTEFSWTNRRKWVFRTTAFCMVVIAYCVFTESNETALTASFTLLGAIGATYVGGATMENMSLAKSGSLKTDSSEK